MFTLQANVTDPKPISRLSLGRQLPPAATCWDEEHPSIIFTCFLPFQVIWGSLTLFPTPRGTLALPVSLTCRILVRAQENNQTPPLLYKTELHAECWVDTIISIICQLQSRKKKFNNLDLLIIYVFFELRRKVLIKLWDKLQSENITTELLVLFRLMMFCVYNFELFEFSLTVFFFFK